MPRARHRRPASSAPARTPERAGSETRSSDTRGAPHVLPEVAGSGVGHDQVLRLQRLVGNREVERMLQRRGRRPGPGPEARPAIQRRWLLVDQGPSSYYFWQERPGETKESSPVPSQWAKYSKVDPPASYQVSDSSSGRLPRGTTIAMTWEQWVATYGSQTKRTNETYNPFGRFYSEGRLTSFIPNESELSPEARKGFLDRLAAKDPDYRPFKTHSKEQNRWGYPLKVFLEDGTGLEIVDINSFGAVYAQKPPTATRAVADPSKAKPVTDLKLKTAPVPMGEPKQGRNFGIDSTLITSFEGKDRGEDQKVVMGDSAGDVAANAGFDPKEGKGWEWLHMIAHSMGGLEVVGPQVQGNLVAGTSECNTQMIIVEEFIKDIVKRAKTKARLVVFVEMYDEARHIGKLISYDVQIGEGQGARVYHYTFDCLSRHQPLTLENRASRYAAQHAFGLGEGQGGFKDEPRKGFTPEQIVKDCVDNIMHVLDMGSEGADDKEKDVGATLDEVLKNLTQLYNPIPPAVFDQLGVLFARNFKSLVPNYLALLLRAMHASPPEHAVSFFKALFESLPGPKSLKGVLTNHIAPFFGARIAALDPGLLKLFTSALHKHGKEQAEEWMKSVGLLGT